MNLMEKNVQVTVTGGSGFIGLHIIIKLINQGYRVKTTIRNLKRENEIRSIISKYTQHDKGDLTFFEADLLFDSNWDEAVKGSSYVLHVASPFFMDKPKNADEELYRPALEGTLRVLKAANRESTVKKIVLTSSMAAVSYGHPPPINESVLDEDTWTNIDGADVVPYHISKTIAEKAAWDFIADEGKRLELVVINPSAVLGPMLKKEFGTSAAIVTKLMDGSVPALPKIGFQIVDVRDVADAHIKAMNLPDANGKRFIVTDRFLWYSEIAKILSDEFKTFGYKIPSLTLPHSMVRFYSIFDPATRSVLNELGVHRKLNNARMVNLLGIRPIRAEDSIIETARTLINVDAIKK
ncbi:MAG: aldehyde reductase [Spirochaetia bacterium]|nr:aldehyde reductase [Spirochaetia bacterium]